MSNNATNRESCPSGSSGCSGADAGQPDKAVRAAARNFVYKTVSPKAGESEPEAAVSARSSDGLLPLLEYANQMMEHCEGQKRYHFDQPEKVEKWRNVQVGIRVMKDEIENQMARA